MAVPIKGDFGTKVNALIRFLLHQDAQHDRIRRRQAGGSMASGEQQLDDEAADEVNYRPKGLVYSQWETELVLVSKALTMNGIKYVELKGSVREDIFASLLLDCRLAIVQELTSVHHTQTLVG